MKNNCKNRFLVWLMFLVPIAITGWWSAIVWTVIQIVLYYREEDKEKKISIPLKERPEIVEMNKPENLTEKDKRILSRMGSGWIKVREGEYMYDRE